MSFAGLKKLKDRANVSVFAEQLRHLRRCPASPRSSAVMENMEEAKAMMEKAGSQVAEKAAAVAKEVKTRRVGSDPIQDIGAMLASADVGKGKRVFNKCKSCHTVNNGGKNGIGPNLWNIVNRTPGEVRRLQVFWRPCWRRMSCGTTKTSTRSC